MSRIPLAPGDLRFWKLSPSEDVRERSRDGQFFLVYEVEESPFRHFNVKIVYPEDGEISWMPSKTILEDSTPATFEGREP